MALPAHSGCRSLIQFRNHFSQTVGLLRRVISPSQGRYLHTGKHKHRINAYTHQTSMPWGGFEPTIPASERAKTVHALDGAATVTGLLSHMKKYCDRDRTRCWDFDRSACFEPAWIRKVIFGMPAVCPYVRLGSSLTVGRILFTFDIF
jgi:hypothetical protein